MKIVTAGVIALFLAACDMGPEWVGKSLNVECKYGYVETHFLKNKGITYPMYMYYQRKGAGSYQLTSADCPKVEE